MGTDLIREARASIEKINPNAEGGTILVSEFMKGLLVAELQDDRINYAVKAKVEENLLSQIVETALQEESEVKSQKFKGNQRNFVWPKEGNYGGLTKYCRLQIKKEVNVVRSVKVSTCWALGKGIVGVHLREGYVARWGMKPRTAEQKALREIGNMVS
jgi:hypothetical protein